MPSPAGLSFNNMSLALDAAIAGHGVVLAYSGAIAAADLAAGRLVRLFSLALPDRFAYHIVTAPGAFERPKVRAFRHWLREEADRTPAGAGVDERVVPHERHAPARLGVTIFSDNTYVPETRQRAKSVRRHFSGASTKYPIASEFLCSK